ncbi:hypothetical protein NDU88_004541 [Pleurodeles waltl]|uniref:Uncharacterized protein n=1 Tax=Pleurodeles waltl TaxID=8319 RepID=A0AAV7RG00_PLEWA|nr:hypothetical protein NDU88_004541 [Pleurodeles waltl]
MHQLLLAAQSHCLFRTEGYEIRITADFSKETNDRQKAFLSLRSQIHQLDVKYGLFDRQGCGSPKMGCPRTFMNQRTSGFS